MTTEDTLPHWDLTEFYESLESEEFRQDVEKFKADIKELIGFFDEEGIGVRAPGETTPRLVVTFEAALQRLDQVEQNAGLLEAFIYGYVTTDSTDELAQGARSELEPHLAKLTVLETRFYSWIGNLDQAPLLESSQLARDHDFPLEEAKIVAQHLMQPELEELASELGITGSSAWSQLHGNVSSQLGVELEVDGELQTLPMSAIRNMAMRPDRDLRRRAFQAELATWKAWEVPLAAAMNSIKGEVNTLLRRRGWDTALEESLFDNRIDRGTLEAMMAAARDAFPVFRRYLRAKAEALGAEPLAWFDLFAPLPGEGGEWSFPAAREFIIEQFGTYSSKLQGLAQRAFDERWIDAEPRVGKRDGAFCMHVVDEQSRVLANFEPGYRSMATLAHELGHAYHNLVMEDKTSFQRRRPMTLAETASIFCETVVKQAVLEQVGPAEQVRILEASLVDGTQVVVDITSRFLFEQELFERRADRNLSAEEMCGLMVESQIETYGEALNRDALHPYMWAVKPHYYSGGRSFYNYPYMFGLLFGLGLYARYKADPQDFRDGYDDLLANTGMGDAASLANGFGIDVRSKEFWAGSLEVIAGDVERFETLLPQV